MSGYLRVLDAEIDLDLPSAKLHTLNTKDRWSILSWSVTKMSIHRIELSSHGRRYSNSATPPQRRRELHSLTICRLLDLLKSLAAYFYLKLQPHPQPILQHLCLYQNSCNSPCNRKHLQTQFLFLHLHDPSTISAAKDALIAGTCSARIFRLRTTYASPE